MLPGHPKCCQGTPNAARAPQVLSVPPQCCQGTPSSLSVPQVLPQDCKYENLPVVMVIPFPVERNNHSWVPGLPPPKRGLTFLSQGFAAPTARTGRGLGVFMGHGSRRCISTHRWAAEHGLGDQLGWPDPAGALGWKTSLVAQKCWWFWPVPVPHFRVFASAVIPRAVPLVLLPYRSPSCE